MSAFSFGQRKVLMSEYIDSQNQHVASGTQIVQNQYGELSTDICMSWQKDKERYYGKRAINLLKRYPKTTFTNLIRLIDIPNPNDSEDSRVACDRE